MNVLVLKPRQQTLDYCLFAEGWSRSVLEGKCHDYRSDDGSHRALAELSRRLRDIPQQLLTPPQPDLIALRGVFGGEEFRDPTVVNAKVIQRLEQLVPHAPLHIPATLSLLRACAQLFKKVPLVLVFETAFFVDLPLREFRYAIDHNLAKACGLRRYGFHGIMHESVSNQVARQRHEMGLHEPARMLSICLEPQPELAAILGNRPLMVTSGATPLEGLPGQTTCGELDPSIVIMLAQKKGWGPEQINNLLTRKSGWLGITGESVGLETLFASDKPECQLAREMFQYRLLQACGAGIAALGGLDVIAFSGRHAGVGVNLGMWLKEKLTLHRPPADKPIAIEFFSESVERVIADHACAAYLSAKTPRPEKAKPLTPTKPAKRRTAPLARSQYAPPRQATAP
jgi:acetate kinase